MALAFINGGCRMNEIAKHFGVHYTTLSRAIKKIEDELHAGGKENGGELA